MTNVEGAIVVNKTNENMEIMESDSAITGGNPQAKFLKGLTEKMTVSARAALLSTVLGEETLTIGQIIDTLDNDGAAGKDLCDMFKALTIADLVDAARGNQTVDEGDDEEYYAHDESEEDEGDENEEDGYDDNDDDDDTVVVEDEEGTTWMSRKDAEEEEDKTEAPKRRRSVAPTKRRAASSSGSREPSDDYKAVESSIMNYARKNLRGEEAAQSKEQIVKNLDAKNNSEMFSVVLKALRESGTLTSKGKARGTKYYLD